MAAQNILDNPRSRIIARLRPISLINTAHIVL